MSNNPYASPRDTYFPQAAAHAGEVERLGFIRKTYAHLAGAIVLFVAIEALLLFLLDDVMAEALPKLGGMVWLGILVGFMIVSSVANYWASSSHSKGMQYAGLGLYVLAQAALFLPMIWMANTFFPGENLVASAGIITGVIFVGLTLVVFLTRVDFKFLGTYLWLGGLGAIAFVVCSLIFGLGFLSTAFSTFMIVLASGYILYYTSNIMYRYRTDQYVAASLALFASVTLLLWYVLRLLMALRR